jgi:hypothetical protein
MQQPIQNTDAYIMMQAAAALEPFKGKPMTPELATSMREAVRPHADRLLRNGHSKRDAISLIAAVWNSMQ